VGPDTDPERRLAREEVRRGRARQGRRLGKDTPNFVGNRIGVHAMMSTIHQMLEDGLAPEDVDAITGVPMGHPKSASFRTADSSASTRSSHVADNCFKALENDEERKIFEVPAFIRTMVEKKLLGDKTKGGFYKKGADKRLIETFDPKTLDYRAKGGDDAIKKATKAIAKDRGCSQARVKKLVADEGKAGAFAWKVLSKSARVLGAAHRRDHGRRDRDR
jgi:3-hydroxyacyl-CoA dehydrogenase